MQLSPSFPGFAPGFLIAPFSYYQHPATKRRRYSHSCNQAQFGDFNITSFNSLSWKPLEAKNVLGSKYQICSHFSFPGNHAWDMWLDGAGWTKVASLREPGSDMGKKCTFPSGLVFGPKFCNPVDSSMAHPAKARGRQRPIRSQTTCRASYDWTISNKMRYISEKNKLLGKIPQP